MIKRVQGRSYNPTFGGIRDLFIHAGKEAVIFYIKHLFTNPSTFYFEYVCVCITSRIGRENQFCSDTFSVVCCLSNDCQREIAGKLRQNIFVEHVRFASTLASMLYLDNHTGSHTSSKPMYWLQRFTKFFVSRAGRVSLLNTEVCCNNCTKTTVHENETHNSNTPVPGVVKLDSTVSGNVTWPDVVKAFDTAFLVLYTIITVSPFLMAM